MSLVIIPLFGMPGMMEWILIGLAIAIFFGAAKLPKLGKGLGEGIRNFKKGIKGELEEEGAIEVAGDKQEENGEKKPNG
ncbi:MAG: twin-arginine translocase TatA/TatE family subunit [Proteobacteria bacterium]|nr:twin-arginine translocase TatA/TatE family subunit [Pseudomonadota bacterium]